VIVVDNDSKDGSVESLTSQKAENKNLRLILNKQNLGFAKANNQAIKIAKGEYIFLLNSDTVVKPGALEKLINFAQETSDAGVVGPKLLNRDGTLQASCFRFPTIKNAIREYWLGKKGLFDKYSPKGNMETAVDAIVGAAFLITPQGLKKAGMLDNRYFMYFEDIDYCRRIKKAGLKVYYYPEAEILHYHGESGKALADKSLQWRRLIPSSKIYHGTLKHYLLTLIIKLGRRWQQLYEDY
jgi:GT2 family glycosyltransferase